jgi:hypothetical protein
MSLQGRHKMAHNGKSLDEVPKKIRFNQNLFWIKGSIFRGAKFCHPSQPRLANWRSKRLMHAVPYAVKNLVKRLPDAPQ